MRRIIAAVVPLALGLAPLCADSAKEPPTKPPAVEPERKPIIRGAHPDPETIAKLVEKLAGREYKSREAAAKTLEARGVESLPELRKEYDAATNAEVRRRLQGMVANLERVQILSPKRLTLKMKDRPLGDAIQEVAKQTGYPIQYQNRANNRVVTIDKENAPFWEVMDHLCNTVGINMYHNEGQGMVVYDNESQVWPNVVYQGPFKIVAQSFNYNKTVNLGPLQRNPAQNQVRNEQLTFQFVMHTEPKLPILGVGQPRVLEAIDELGNSMRPSDHGSHESHYPPNYHGSRTYQCGPGIALSWPNKEARTLKRLRVAMPVVLLSEQRPEIVVENIVGMKAKKFTGGSVEMQIDEVKEENNKTLYKLKMSVRNLAPNAAQDYTWTNSVYQRIELQDAKGNRWYSQGYDWGSSSPGHVQATFMFGNNGPNPPGPPAKLIYYHWSMLQHSVEFEFKDLQLP